MGRGVDGGRLHAGEIQRRSCAASGVFGTGTGGIGGAGGRAEQHGKIQNACQQEHEQRSYQGEFHGGDTGGASHLIR
jgi:hypothetical protein